ncbi:dynein regulatory complex protein 9-like [Diprion similis]|uniref:dynein regulatory complex protein 9-like n=1 Tax=Diprion similis TaxID=362088 RepID=UPI001EF83462|nr:dynein regulatory complex protein 9-like [Diprion similis]
MNTVAKTTKSSDEENEPEASTEQRNSYTQQRHSSSNALAKISAVTVDQRRASAVGQATISSVPKHEQLAEDTRTKSTHMVVTNVMRISGSELEPNLQNYEETQSGQMEKAYKKETNEQKRVMVQEVPKDEQDTTDDRVAKNKPRIQPFMGKAVPDASDIESTTPVSRWPIGNKGSASGANVRSLTMDHQPAITLSSLEAACFSSVLQECLDFLNILRYVIPAEVDERWDERYKTIAELYGVPDEPKMIFREDMGLLPLIPSVAEKIQRDRTYAYEILRRTTSNIRDNKTFESLELVIDDIVKTQEGERELQINWELWTEQAKQLQDLVDYDKLEFEDSRKQRTEMVQKVNADVDNSIFFNGSQLGYVERWEDAQLEKQELKLAQKEEQLLNLKANCEKLEKADQIVSGEVRTYLEANTREMEDEIISWTSQYIEELERREQEMTELKDHIEGQLVELEELSLLRDARQVFIDEVLAEKERVKKEEEYWREIHRVATLIQAQWRGYMVRKQIGPFKGLRARLKKRKGKGSKAQKKAGKGRKKPGTSPSKKKK